MRMGTSLRDIRRISLTRASLESRSGAFDASTSSPGDHAVGGKQFPEVKQKISQFPPGFEPGIQDSKSWVLNHYTTGTGARVTEQRLYFF